MRNKRQAHMVARVIRTSTIASNMFVNNLIIFRICNHFLSAYKWSRSTFFEESLNSDIGINLHSFLFKSYHFFMFWLGSNLIATFLDWNYMRLHAYMLNKIRRTVSYHHVKMWMTLQTLQMTTEIETAFPF